MTKLPPPPWSGGLELVFVGNQGNSGNKLILIINKYFQTIYYNWYLPKSAARTANATRNQSVREYTDPWSTFINVLRTSKMPMHDLQESM